MNLDFNNEHGSDVQRLRHLQPRAPNLHWESIERAANRSAFEGDGAHEERVVYVQQPARSTWSVWVSGALVGAAATFIGLKFQSIETGGKKTVPRSSQDLMVSDGSEMEGKPKPLEMGVGRGVIRQADLRYAEQLLSSRRGLEVRVLTATKLAPVADGSVWKGDPSDRLLEGAKIDEERVMTPKELGRVLREWDRPTT